MSFKRLLIHLPAYNEEKTVFEVISQIKKIKKYIKNIDVLVVNDGSKDDTQKVVERTKTSIINLPFNLGIGGAVETGLKYALNHGFDYAIQIDADGQHDPAFIPKMLKKANEGHDLVIGSRYLKKTGYKGLWTRRLGNTIISCLIFLICGKRIYDTTSGFRVFSRKALNFLVHEYPIGFPEPESIVKLLRSHHTIAEVSVEMKQRSAGNSYVTSVRAIYIMLSISLSILIEAIKKNKKL